MNIYLFEYIGQVSSSYHSGGGLVVIAKDREAAQALIDATDDVEVEAEEWEMVKIFPTSEEIEPTLFTFPDAGCC